MEKFLLHTLIIPLISIKLAYKPHSVYRPWDSHGSYGDHLSWTAITGSLLQPTRMLNGASRSAIVPDPEDRRTIYILLGLAPGGVCLAGAITAAAGGLLHHRFTLTCRKYPAGTMLLCCTCRRVAPPGR